MDADRVSPAIPSRMGHAIELAPRRSLQAVGHRV